MARSSMERLLEMIVKIFPEFRCVNSNDGVKIAHTVTKHLNELDTCPDFGEEFKIKTYIENEELLFNAGAY